MLDSGFPQPSVLRSPMRPTTLHFTLPNLHARASHPITFKHKKPCSISKSNYYTLLCSSLWCHSLLDCHVSHTSLMGQCGAQTSRERKNPQHHFNVQQFLYFVHKRNIRVSILMLYFRKGWKFHSPLSEVHFLHHILRMNEYFKQDLIIRWVMFRQIYSLNLTSSSFILTPVSL